MYNSGNRGSKAANVAHNWANQLDSSLKKDTIAGSLYYEGKTIYSYGSHFPIATICTNKAGLTAVLFTTSRHSNTTSKHIAHVRSACSHLNTIKCNDPFSALSGNHFINIESFEKLAKSEAMNLVKAKKPEIYLNSIAYQKELLTKYVEFFNLLKDKAYKKTINALVYINIVSKDGGNKATEKERKAIEKRKKEQAIIEAKQLAQSIKDFKTFDTEKGRFVTDYIYNGQLAYLRHNTETNRIETSKQVIIPIAIAKRAFKWVLDTLKNGGCEGECKFKIMDFEVSALNDKQLIVGCHTIDLSEVNALAKSLNWI